MTISGVPFRLKLPFASVVPLSTKCSESAAFPGTSPVSLDLTR